MGSVASGRKGIYHKSFTKLSIHIINRDNMDIGDFHTRVVKFLSSWGRMDNSLSFVVFLTCLSFTWRGRLHLWTELCSLVSPSYTFLSSSTVFDIWVGSRTPPGHLHLSDGNQTFIVRILHLVFYESILCSLCCSHFIPHLDSYSMFSLWDFEDFCPAFSPINTCNL